MTDRPDIIDANDALPQSSALFDNIGTSTSDDEAPLREIGRVAFGIRYPLDITPTQKRLNARAVLK